MKDRLRCIVIGQRSLKNHTNMPHIDTIPQYAAVQRKSTSQDSRWTDFHISSEATFFPRRFKHSISLHHNPRRGIHSRTARITFQRCCPLHCHEVPKRYEDRKSPCLCPCVMCASARPLTIPSYTDSTINSCLPARYA